jgi:Uma2 family endonuclease
MAEPVTQQPPTIHMSIQDYLRFDDETPGKHEFHRGTVIAMAGGTSNHSAISFNLGGEIRQKLRGTTCQGFNSDVRIGIPGVPSFNYPDISVVCGPVQFDTRDRSSNTVTNPKLVIEVLLPSTEQIDRGRKFENYLQIESLEEYVLVSQDRPRVESYYRQPDGSWGAFSFADGMQSYLKLHSLGFEIPLTEIYANVVFPAAESVEDVAL